MAIAERNRKSHRRSLIGVDDRTRYWVEYGTPVAKISWREPHRHEYFTCAKVAP